MPTSPSLQEQYAPDSICYGCGPANDRGFRLHSYAEGDEVVAVWQAEAHHQAFEGFLNGGVIGTLFDCHCNWTAAYHLMRRARRERVTVPPTVTLEFAVRFKRPTPSSVPVTLRAHVVDASDDRAIVEGTLESNGLLCATCRGTFVVVPPGHPAYHRWHPGVAGAE